MAVIDVGLALLEPLLNILRASRQYAEIPLLVENSRIAAASPAGLLPKYRAMLYHFHLRPRAGGGLL